MTNVFFTLILTVSCIQGALADNSTSEISNSQAWGFGILAGAGLSLLGFVAALIIVAVRKLIQEKTFKILVNLLYALGCGAMVGDSMIHILPQAYKNQHTNFKFVALIFIASIFAFLGIQRLFVVCGIAHQHWGEEDHDHSHNHGKQHKHSHNHGENQCQGEINVDENVNNDNQLNSPKKNENKSKETNELKLTTSSKVMPVVDITTLKNRSQNILQIKIDSNAQIKNEEENKSDEEKTEGGCLQRYRGKGSAGYLNLMSSFIHNFFDGFAIGAAFASKSKDTIIPTIIAVYVHEIPREMGDVGVLLKNRFNSMQTILCNGVINLIALVGVVVGLALGTINESVQIYILTFVAGNFIYIGADIWRNLLKNKSACSNLLEFFSFCLGVGAMYLVLLAQHQH